MNWRDIEAYYDDDQRRRFSGESDYGCWYKDGAGGNWRVSYVDTTREVYAVYLGGGYASEVLLGGEPVLIAGAGHGDGPVVLLGTFTSEPEADAALADWAQHCGEPGSLQWAWDRTRGGREQAVR